LGRIVADDPDPELRGNYVGIINPPKSEKVNRLYADVKSFLEKIQFTGLSNFDFKFDVEKNEFKVFEMNLRQGRSSYFSIMAGSNYAKAIIEDIFSEQTGEITVGNDPFIWTNCSTKGFFQFIKKKDLKLYKELKKIDNVGNTLEYDKDTSIRRNIRIKKYLKKYSSRINKLI